MQVTSKRCLEILFPAYAGVILELSRNQIITKAFPRLRGGDP